MMLRHGRGLWRTGRSARQRRLISSGTPRTATETGQPIGAPSGGTPVAEAKSPTAPSKGSGVLLWLGAGTAVAGGYLYYTGVLNSPLGVERKVPPPMTPQIVPPPLAAVAPKPPELSVREEYELKQKMLQAELETLRAQKRDKFVNTKKKEIKEDLKIIAKSIAALDKEKK